MNRKLIIVTFSFIFLFILLAFSKFFNHPNPEPKIINNSPVASTPAPTPSPTPIPQRYTFSDVDNLLLEIRKSSPVKFDPQTIEIKWQELKYFPKGSDLSKPYYISGHAMQAEIIPSKYNDFLTSFLKKQGFTNIYDRQLPVWPAVLGLHDWYIKDNILCSADDSVGIFGASNTDGSDKYFSQITCGILP